MKDRRIAAHYIFPGSLPFLKYGILELDSKSCIAGMEDTGGKLTETAHLEFYNGILLPGFVLANIDNELCKIAADRQSDTIVRDTLSGLMYKSLNHGPVKLVEDCRNIIMDLITLQELFPEQELGTWLSLFTYIPAKKLHIADTFGSFQPGKKPGIILLSGSDLHAMKILKRSRATFLNTH